MSNNDSLFGLWPEEGLIPKQRNHTRKRKKHKRPSQQRDVEVGLLLEEIAETSDSDLIFEPDENDALPSLPASPLHSSSRIDIEAPDPQEIIEGTVPDDEVEDDEEEQGGTRRKLLGAALAVTAVVGLGALKVLENSTDLDDVTDFDASFSNDGGGGVLMGARAEAGGAARGAGDAAAATKGSSDGIVGGGGKAGGNDTGAGGKAAGNDGGGGTGGGNDAGAGGARSQSQPQQ